MSDALAKWCAKTIMIVAWIVLALIGVNVAQQIVNDEQRASVLRDIRDDLREPQP